MRLDSFGIISQIHRHAQNQSVAAFYQERSLSYQEWNCKSYALALELAARGVTAGTAVGVCLRPGFDILLAIAAIFRCNAVYLPLDPDHPEAYRQRILSEAKPSLILMHRIHETSHGRQTPAFVFMDEIIFAPSIVPEPRRLEGRDREAAYLMYTSGTTGQPKGVLISNDNLHHYLSSAQKAFQFSAQDTFCSMARYTFSISLFDLLLPLVSGASVRLVDRSDIFELDRLSLHLAQSTVFHAGPSLLTTLSRYRDGRPFLNLRHVSTGGDLVLPVVMEKMKENFPNAEIFVIYGTTEISCMGTFLAIPRQHKLNCLAVGKPFPHVEVSLLDKDSAEVGEICFAGAGVGMGYLNNAALTDEKFPSLHGIRSYRTGDFGRQQADGSIEIIGRRDFQVQVRGIRIELAAIENHILELGLATQCVVVYRKLAADDSGYLLAYLVGAVQRESNDLRDELKRLLPVEMIPGDFQWLDALPLTFNGKVDRMTLVQKPHAISEKRAPMNVLQESLAEIFRRILHIESIGLKQNFFELGGHSLLAVLILNEIKEKLGYRILPHAFFQQPTVHALALHCSSGQDVMSSCNAIPLHASGAAKAIFCLSGVHIYRTLSKALSEHRQVIGVISERELGSQWSEETSLSIESLAADFVQVILRQQKQGPYEILGYSFAGILTVEVARQLMAAGHRVSRLVLLDAILPEWVMGWRYRMRQLGRIFRAPPRDLFAYLVRKLGKKPRTEKDPRYHSLEKDRGHRNRMLAEDYLKRMPRYSGPVLLFVAAERKRLKPLHSPSCGWSPYLPNLTIRSIAADHFSLIEDRQSVQAIVEALADFDRQESISLQSIDAVS